MILATKVDIHKGLPEREVLIEDTPILSTNTIVASDKDNDLWTNRHEHRKIKIVIFDGREYGPKKIGCVCVLSNDFRVALTKLFNYA